MTNRLFIITGTSRGIGYSLAQKLLHNGDIVCGISRGSVYELEENPNFFQYSTDLENLSTLDEIIDSALHIAEERKPEMICLINNAAMLEPLKPIEKCLSNEIESNLKVGLVAPAILTANFISKSNDLKVRRKIINISSGSGKYPSPSMSLYCTSKAGLNMFTQCVGLEQNNNGNPVEIIAVEPGMVETRMQQTARSQPEDEFAMAKYFKDAQVKGELMTADELVDHLLRIIDQKIVTGNIINYTYALESDH